MKIPILFLTLLLCLTACKKNNSTPSEEARTSDTLSKPSPSFSEFGISDKSQLNGLKVGEDAPQLNLTTSSGEQQSLASFYKDQALVVIFYRGYWCPSCNRYLSEFSERSDELKAKGVKLLAITPESYENIKTTKNETGLNFTVISDTDGNVMKAFDVLFEVTEDYQDMIETNLKASISESNASKKAILPVPATYIIDTTGTIVYRHFDLDYNNRASVDDILKHI